jgi:XTP/dITP diphosphohydrolase
MRSLAGQRMLLATTNTGKRDEFAGLLAPFGIDMVSLADLGLHGPDETEHSFTGNALLKARAGVAASGLITLADDSGLVVADLGGAPGIHTADWAETATGRDFRVAMTKTWGLLTATRTPAPHQAEFRCTLAVAWPDGAEAVFEGRLPGQIVWPMRGALGHGYDPIFQPDGQTITMGEMDLDQKNRISHRAHAVDALIAGCLT